ncbi:MAG: pyridoxamine 5'-phosphate oxidase family protein [Actinomycetota bacterium]|nr:pyridoxamine 5'-phosphate oxidase family protein [Actinomycetota bacterium]
MDIDHYASLLAAASPAVLTTYRANGQAVASPVWFRAVDGHAEVVIAETDIKIRHLRRHPECSLLIFETNPPFRGIRIEGTPALSDENLTEARLAISTRYLGEESGRRFTSARGPAFVLRLPIYGATSWDLAAILPG